MNTPPENDFAELRRLLSLKRHEQPPPGYFNAFPRRVIASIQAQSARREAVDAGASVPAWVLTFLERLQARPAFASLVGAGLCALVLGAVLILEKDAQRPQPMPSVLAEITHATPQPAPEQESASKAFQPLTADVMAPLVASNQWQTSPGPSLFDLTPGLNTAPVGHRP